MFARSRIKSGIRCLIAAVALCSTSGLPAQEGFTYLPGKAYLIRLSPCLGSADTSAAFPLVRSSLQRAGGMVHYVQDHLITLNRAGDNCWFVGYCHPQRQAKDDLLRDHNLLQWLLHGEDVELMPIEHASSPVEMPGLMVRGAR